MQRIDPVCGMPVPVPPNVEPVDLGESELHFCSRACRDAFLADPSAYGITAYNDRVARPLGAGTTGRESARRRPPLSMVGAGVSAATMLVLHLSYHRPAFVLAGGAAVYLFVLACEWIIARGRERRQNAVEKANLASYLRARDQDLYGR